MSTEQNTKAPSLDEIVNALMASDQAIVENLRELNIKIANISASQKTSPFTAFSMSIDQFSGLDLHFSATIVEEAMKGMLPALLPALEAMQHSMLLKTAKTNRPKKQAAVKGNKTAKSKKAR